MILLALALLAPSPDSTLYPQTLYSQTVAAILARTPVPPQTDYLVLDLRSREFLADTFADVPIPVGSLLKPLLAAISTGPPQTTTCHGRSDRCWRQHGPMTLSAALAQSCNAFFLALAARLTPAELSRLTLLGLPEPPPLASPATLIGLNPAWRIPPESLAQAYATLLAAHPSAAILAGLRASATSGTASALGPHAGGVLAKTGTAPCMPQPAVPCVASGDGLIVALVPAVNPTLLVLVRRRATTGAVAARTAGQILTAIEALHAR